MAKAVPSAILLEEDNRETAWVGAWNAGEARREARSHARAATVNLALIFREGQGGTD
jgi:hypothetical protein